MPTQTRAEIALPESTGYLEVDGAYLHATLHAAAAPVARILLIGAFASQRQYSYLPWIRWARYLATRQLEVLRFDYRGMGESTGQFEQATYADWLRDVRALAHWLNSRLPAAPLILHGLEMGAILAGKVFDEGCGDMLLLWSPPDKANQALRSTLLSWIAIEQIFKVGAERKSASEYIRKLESGSSLDVEGYTWTQQLWRESFAFDLPSALANEESAGAAYKRPVRIVKLSKAAAPLVKGGFVGYDEFKDFSPIFDTNADWIERTLMTSREGAGDRGGEQMIEAIETRELITLDRSGIPLRGTYHKPISLQTVPESGPSSCRRLGILFLNSLSLPAHGNRRLSSLLGRRSGRGRLSELSHRPAWPRRFAGLNPRRFSRLRQFRGLRPNDLSRRERTPDTLSTFWNAPVRPLRRGGVGHFCRFGGQGVQRVGADGPILSSEPGRPSPSEAEAEQLGPVEQAGKHVERCLRPIPGFPAAPAPTMRFLATPTANC